MIIKSIKIDGFGKHKNLSVNFSQGLNIVYGFNEVGKSTLQAFIKAMFYGLVSRTRNIADNPRKKYTPWKSEYMGGEIVFSHKGLEYSLARMFGESRNKDRIILSLTSTGEQIPMDVKSEPGEHLFNISQATFESTLFVGQLDSKIDSATAKDSDILCKLSNLAGTGDENIDINEIESNLVRPMNYLHTARGKNGYIDKLKSRLSVCEEELAEFETVKNTSLNIIHDLNVYTARKESILDEINSLKRQLSAADSQKSIVEFNKIKEIKDKGHSQEELLKETKEALIINGKTIDRTFYEECSQDYKSVESASDEFSAPSTIFNNARETVASAEEKIATLEYLNKFNLETFEDVNSLKNEISRSIERKKMLDLQLTDAMIDLESKQAKISATPKKRLYTAIIPALAAILTTIIGIVFMFINLTVGCVTTAVGIIALLLTLVLNFISKNKKEHKTEIEYSRKNVDSLTALLESIQADIDSYISEKSQTTQSQFKEIGGEEPITAYNLEGKHALLSKYITSTLASINCTSIQDIKEKLSAYKTLKVQREEAMNTITSLTDAYNEKERKSCNTMSAFYNKYADIFSLSPPEEIKEMLNQILKNLNKYDSLLMEISYSSEFFKNALDGRSYEKLEQEALLANENNTTEGNLPTDAETIKSKLEELENDLNKIKDVIADTNVRIASNFKVVRDKSEILSEMDELTFEIERLEHQYKCMKIAKEILKESFSEMQQSFGPKLNKRATEILNSIKPENLSEIHVSREFNITLSPKNSTMPYDIDYFSNGAQDQAYFALRIAISDILSIDFDGFPLLLDDPFVQYDEKRMMNAVEFLSEVSKLRQVFIFTCHKNVFEHAETLGGNCFKLSTAECEEK